MSFRDTKKSDIKLAWVKDKEEMEITFANRKKDKIILAKSNYQGVDVGCLFSGALESDHDSEVQTHVVRRAYFGKMCDIRQVLLSGH